MKTSEPTKITKTHSDKFCIKCNSNLEMIFIADNFAFPLRYCDNPKCKRFGLLTAIYNDK